MSDLVTYFEILSLVSYAPWNVLIWHLRRPLSRLDLVDCRNRAIGNYVRLADEWKDYQICIDNDAAGSPACHHPQSPSIADHTQQRNESITELIRIERDIAIVGRKIERAMKQLAN